VHRLDRDRRVTILRGRTVSVTADRETSVQADGDPAGVTPLRAHVLPRALTLLRPRPA
jgi:diacylglycerol kinase family enzyme